MIWIAFQRAVNVAGRKYPMAQLRTGLEAGGFTDSETYIQTGNIRLGSPMRSAGKLQAGLESLFEEGVGFAVDTIVMRPAELAQIAEDTVDIAAEHGPFRDHYVELLREPLSVDDAAVVQDWADEATTPVVRGRAVHLLVDEPFHNVRGPTVALKRAYGVSTNRNARVIRTLALKWGLL